MLLSRDVVVLLEGAMERYRKCVSKKSCKERHYGDEGGIDHAFSRICGKGFSLDEVLGWSSFALW